MKVSFRWLLPLALSASICVAQSSMSMKDSQPASSTSSAAVMIHTVTVSKVPHRFDPDTLDVMPGDIISFEFFPANHSVIRGTYESPCIPYEYTNPNDQEGAIWSDWQPVSMVMDDDEMPWWNYTVETNGTKYLYCGAPGSCNKSGMVMILNPNATVSIDLYRAKALEAPFVLTPGEAWPNDENGPSSSTMSSTMVPSSSSLPSATTIILQASPTISASSTAVAAASSSSKGVPIGAIAGIVIGSIALIAIIALLFYVFLRKGRVPNDVFHPSHGAPAAPAPAPVDHDRKGMTEVVVDPYTPGGYSVQSPTTRSISASGTMSPLAPARETIIIPMTEEEKNMYLEKLAAGSQGFNGSVRSLGSNGPRTRNSRYGTSNRPAEMPAGRMSAYGGMSDDGHFDEEEEGDEVWNSVTPDPPPHAHHRD